MTIELEERHRQIVLLAIARLAVERPGWIDVTREIADKLGGLEMFAQFKKLREEEDAA